MNEAIIPTYQDMMNPLLEALRNLGGSATNDEMYSEVTDIMDLSDEVLAIVHDEERGYRSEVEYRLAWTRSYLKKYGLIDNSSRGVWALTKKGREVEDVDPLEVTQYYRDIRKKEKSIQDEIDDEGEITWQEELLETLLSMDPSAFERLIQRVLRESGFTQVQVTGRSGDGGIDGKGIMRLSGLLSFHVIFQCKRYKGVVSVGKVRDFRGAMVGRADKGLLITTGNFTQDAIREATRDGAPPIDLIDGEKLTHILKGLSLGVETEVVEMENVYIDNEWFLSL